MKFYEKTDAIETLEAMFSAYDKKTLAKELATYAISSLHIDGKMLFPFINLEIIKEKGKFAIEIKEEE